MSTAHKWVHPWSTVCADLPVVKQSRIIQEANEKSGKKKGNCYNWVALISVLRKESV